MKVYSFSSIFVENAIELAKEYKFNYTETIDFEDNETYIIFGAHDRDYAYKLLLYKYKNKKDYIVINSEQPSSTQFNNKYYLQLLRVSHVIDYNSTSVDIINKTVNPAAKCCYFFDFPINVPKENKEYDIVFVGSRNTTRENVFKCLKKKYPDKNILFDFGYNYTDINKLTKLLTSTKIVLNIPYYSDGILEAHRINKALSCGCTVVSTKGKEEHINTIYEDYIHFTDDLVNFDYDNVDRKLSYNNLREILYKQYNFNDILKVKVVNPLIRTNLKFYTCFFGDDNNIAFKIPPIPSINYKCYYFTNNIKLIEQLEKTDWVGIIVNTPIKKDFIKDAFDSKIYKCCPHFFKELNDADYTCYFDSKIEVNVNRVVSHITDLNYEKVIILPKHPFIKENIWDEYNEAIKQERYNKQKNIYEKYILDKLSKNFNPYVKHHATTHFILRKNTTICNNINEEWYSNILDCGIMCQIPFFFIQQEYNKNIKFIDTYDGYNYLKI